MPTISVELDHDLHLKVKKFAEGVGVDLGELVERALVYALSSRYPDNSLPGQPATPDNTLPGDQPEIDNGLPPNPFNPEIDNELPEGEVPVDPGYGNPGGSRPVDPGFGTSGQGVNPDLDPNLNPDLGRKGPATPKK